MCLCNACNVLWLGKQAACRAAWPMSLQTDLLENADLFLGNACKGGNCRVILALLRAVSHSMNEWPKLLLLLPFCVSSFSGPLTLTGWSTKLGQPVGACGQYWSATGEKCSVRQGQWQCHIPRWCRSVRGRTTSREVECVLRIAYCVYPRNALRVHGKEWYVRDRSDTCLFKNYSQSTLYPNQRLTCPRTIVCHAYAREARTSISPRNGGRRPERGDVGRDRRILTYQTSDCSKTSSVCIYSNGSIVRNKYIIRNTHMRYAIRNWPRNTQYATDRRSSSVHARSIRNKCTCIYLNARAIIFIARAFSKNQRAFSENSRWIKINQRAFSENARWIKNKCTRN